MDDIRVDAATSLMDGVAATAEYREQIIAEMRLSLEQTFADVRTALAVAMLLEELRGQIEYHLGWRHQDLSLADGQRGKLLRPSLTLLSCMFVAGRAGNRGHTYKQLMRRAAVAGASIELVHNFSLVHDDIEDSDEERRHRPTLWKLWGVPLAINTGDTILAIGRLTLWRLPDAGMSPDAVFPLADLLDRATLQMCEGQFLDLRFEGRLDVSTDMYMDMIERKTAALMSCATQMGSLLGCDDPDLVTLLAEYGRRMGLAFQLRDDLLGIWATTHELGKQQAGDLRRKKVTLPVICAMERATTADQDRLTRLYADRRPATDQQIADMLEILERTGARQAATRAVIEQVDAARRVLDTTADRVFSPASSGATQSRGAYHHLGVMLDGIVQSM
ncbi:MAG TPA: polyprenyl synthetase family protein [Ktedonobacterales bacterium]